MHSLNTCYKSRSRIRLRPVPEMGQCLVYDPAGPRLFTLNTTSWLVLLLCKGVAGGEILREFHREVEPLLTVEQVREHVDEALRDLLAKRLIESSLALEKTIPVIIEGG